MIAFCPCPHKFQDARYGPNMRVHNPLPDGKRCTACGQTRESAAQKPIKAPKGGK